MNKPKPYQRCATRMNHARIQDAICDKNHSTPTSVQIWNSIRDHDTPRSIRGFLWKSIHSPFKISDFWENIPNYENCGKCSLCGASETMEHILLECDKSAASKTIWNAAQKLWCKREATWPHIILESVHLIWKIRCKCAIKYCDNPELYHTKREVYNRWLKSINNRLKMDKLLTDTMRYGKKATKIDKVLRTWSGILPNNWIRQSGVLVGPPGRNR
ncbi:hypothetical protein C8R48DRAFT_748606 [Suillus tomentosus]|nr:hypothetical protein C8R48DRAFT_748606 [Suillus tomentosus]